MICSLWLSNLKNTKNSIAIFLPCILPLNMPISIFRHGKLIHYFFGQPITNNHSFHWRPNSYVYIQKGAKTTNYTIQLSAASNYKGDGSINWIWWRIILCPWAPPTRIKPAKFNFLLVLKEIFSWSLRTKKATKGNFIPFIVNRMTLSNGSSP